MIKLNNFTSLVTPDEGCIRLNGTTLSLPKQGILAQIEDRRIGYVFQNSAVFPHLSVRENIAYGLRARGASPSEITAQVRDLSRIMGLDSLAGVRASRLSGGQKQRVALARAIAIRPTLLMMDEPFSSLDLESTRAVKDLIKRSVTEMQIPCIIVTHHVSDCHEIGDRVRVISSGKKEWEGDPCKMPGDCSVCQCPSGSP